MNTRTGLRVFVLLALAPQLALAATIIVPDHNPSLVAAVAGAAPGDTVQVRPGNYSEGAAVLIRQDGLTIEGLGGRPLLTGANRKEAFRVRGAAGVVLRGFDVQGRVSAVRLNDCVGCTVQDFVVTDCDEGVRVIGGELIAIIGNTFTNVRNHEAVRASSSDFVFVAGNVMTGTRKAGVRLSTSPNSVIVGNTITSPRMEGIRLASCRDAIVDTNVISGGQSDGIAVTGSSDDTSINANSVTGCARRGVRTTSSSDALVITDNTVADNGNNGFDFRSVGAFVDGNVATGNGGDGFRVGNSSPLTFTDNTATDNDGFGFDVFGLDEADLLGAGNAASGNLQGDFR